jgi:hypothetical protein
MRVVAPFVLLAALPLLLAHDDGCCSSHDDDGAEFRCLGTEDPFTPGFSRAGNDGNLSIVLLEATPSPHFVQNNDLRIRVEDADGDPVEGVTFVDIEPFTAAHDHGTPIDPEAVELGGGEYEITMINYVHRGPWYLTFEMDTGTVTDTVRFTFCIMDPPGVPDGGP